MSERVYTVAEVARATGLSKHVLHKWERRYGAVQPERSPSGHRRYSQDDLLRLQRLARLSAGGHSISQLVTLTAQELAELRVDPAHSGPVLAEPLHALFVGPLLSDMLGRHRELFAWPNLQIEVRAGEPGPDTLGAAVAPDIDVLVVELPAVSAAAAAALGGLARERARCVIVVYHFASRASLAALMDAGVTCLKAPLTAAGLARQVLLGVDAQQAERPPLAAGGTHLAVPAQRFSRRALSQVLAVTPQLKCECPNHIASLLIDLGAFEQYSLACADQGPEDRELHAYLRWVAASSRALLEDALARVAEVDGIDIDALG